MTFKGSLITDEQQGQSLFPHTQPLKKMPTRAAPLLSPKTADERKWEKSSHKRPTYRPDANL